MKGLDQTGEWSRNRTDEEVSVKDMKIAVVDPGKFSNSKHASVVGDTSHKYIKNTIVEEGDIEKKRCEASLSSFSFLSDSQATTEGLNFEECSSDQIMAASGQVTMASDSSFA